MPWVIVGLLAVSRERCVLHVDRMWASTREREGFWLMWTHVDRGGSQKPD